MSWSQAKQWLCRLRADAAAAPQCDLSHQGMQLILGTALDTLQGLEPANLGPAQAPSWRTANLIVTRTSPTACIEWLFLLLGRGTLVHLKVPADAPGLGPWLTHHARHCGLPLTCTTDRTALPAAQLVIVMGSDDTIQAVASGLHPSEQQLIGLGHRFGAAWWGRDADHSMTAKALARDIAAHDTRGCMSPAVVCTPSPRDVLPWLCRAMEEAEQLWPRGSLSDHEHAQQRARGALVQVIGERTQGSKWHVHIVPAAHITPASSPRCVQLVAAADIEEMATHLARWAHHLGTIGTTEQISHARRLWRDCRVCAIGEMQQPPLPRHHDGHDVLAVTWGP